MAWGSLKSAKPVLPPPPPPPSLASPPLTNKFKALIPLFFLFLFLGVVALVMRAVYESVTAIRHRATEKFQADHGNIKISSQGVSVGVRNRTNEQYVDKTQKYVVNAWNLRHASDPPRKNSGGGLRGRLWGGGSSKVS